MIKSFRPLIRIRDIALCLKFPIVCVTQQQKLWRDCADAQAQDLVAYVISIIFSCTSSYIYLFMNNNNIRCICCLKEKILISVLLF